jgi:hypothetical protein
MRRNRKRKKEDIVRGRDKEIADTNREKKDRDRD